MTATMTATASTLRADGLRLVWLHGRLRKRFGGPFALAVKSPQLAIRALCVQLPGLRQALRDHDFFVVRGNLRRGFKFDRNMLDMHIGDGHDLHFYPVPNGAKHGGGALKIVIGIVMIAASIVTFGAAAAVGAGAIAGLSGSAFGGALAGASIGGVSLASIGVSIGLSIALSGIAQLVSPQPKTQTDTGANENSTFGGPANIGTQGGPVPLLFGRFLAGSVVIESSLRNDDVLLSLVTNSQPPKTGLLYGATIGRSAATGDATIYNENTIQQAPVPPSDAAAQAVLAIANA